MTNSAYHMNQIAANYSTSEALMTIAGFFGIVAVVALIYTIFASKNNANT